MDVNIIVGIAGMVFILVAFILDEFIKRWSQNTMKYNLFNLLGSGCLMYYASTLRSIPFLVLNAVWFITSAVKIFKIIK